MQEDIQEKVRVIEIYNHRLTERERRRQFVMDRKLINVRKQQNLDRRRNPPEREMYARLKAIARYLPQQEFEVLPDGVVTETRLRARIQVQHSGHISTGCMNDDCIAWTMIALHGQ